MRQAYGAVVYGGSWSWKFCENCSH